MKPVTSLAVAACLVTASASGDPKTSRGAVENDLIHGDRNHCPRAVFIFARGTGSKGNMGTGYGPTVADALERHYSNETIWVQGVGEPYAASVLQYLQQPYGTAYKAVEEANRLITLSLDTCPSSSIVLGGSSQGSNVIAGAASRVSPLEGEAIRGAILFGYPFNLRNKGRIPKFPTSKVAVYCNPGDMICSRSFALGIKEHFSYDDEAQDEAPKFLISRLESRAYALQAR